MKKSFEDDAKRLVESNVCYCNNLIFFEGREFLLRCRIFDSKEKFRLLKEKLENENNSVKKQFVAIQVGLGLNFIKPL